MLSSETHFLHGGHQVGLFRNSRVHLRGGFRRRTGGQDPSRRRYRCHGQPQAHSLDFRGFVCGPDHRLPRHNLPRGAHPPVSTPHHRVHRWGRADLLRPVPRGSGLEEWGRRRGGGDRGQDRLGPVLDAVRDRLHGRAGGQNPDLHRWRSHPEQRAAPSCLRRFCGCAGDGHRDHCVGGVVHPSALDQADPDPGGARPRRLRSLHGARVASLTGLRNRSASRRFQNKKVAGRARCII